MPVHGCGRHRHGHNGIFTGPRNWSHAMNFFHLVPRHLLTRTLLPLMIGGLAVALSGCGAADDEGSSGKAASNKNGVTIKSEGLVIDATVSGAILQGYSSQPLSVRLMNGWVNREQAKSAGKLTDETEKRKQAMKSFGVLAVRVDAGKAEPGTYQLVPEAKDPESGTVTIGKEEDAGLPDNYTSQSGTLTIKSVTMSEDGKAVKALAGSFDGQFKGDDGNSRAFTGDFHFVPKKKKKK